MGQKPIEGSNPFVSAITLTGVSLMRISLILAATVFALSACEDPRVDAYYYPDRTDLSEYDVAYDVGSVEACREWVEDKAFENNDQRLERGDYECGIDPEKNSSFGGLTVYRETVR